MEAVLYCIRMVFEPPVLGDRMGSWGVVGATYLPPLEDVINFNSVGSWMGANNSRGEAV